MIDPLKVTWRWLTESTLVSKEACLLHGAWYSPSSGGGEVNLRDGHNSSADKFFQMTGGSAAVVPFVPPIAAPFKKGLYVHFGSKVIGVLVAWEPIPPRTNE